MSQPICAVQVRHLLQIGESFPPELNLGAVNCGGCASTGHGIKGAYVGVLTNIFSQSKAPSESDSQNKGFFLMEGHMH